MCQAWVKSIAVLLLCIAYFPSSAQAFDSRLGVDPNVSLSQLASSGTTTTSSGRNGNLYYADASSVLHVDADRLFAAAQDYDHYVQFGMPHLNEAHVVERDSPELLFAWASMSIAVLHSQHYLEVHIHPRLNDFGGRGMEWQLADKKPGWPYNEASAFSHSDGSFFIQPLQDGTVYVRYYLSNDVNLPLSGLLSGIIQSQLRKGASDVITMVARQAPASH